MRRVSILGLGVLLVMGVGAPSAAAQREPHCVWVHPTAVLVSGLTDAPARVRAQTTGTAATVGDKAAGVTEYPVVGYLRARSAENTVIVEEHGADGHTWRIRCPVVPYVYDVRRPDRERVIGSFLGSEALGDIDGTPYVELTHGTLDQTVLDELARLEPVPIRIGIFDPSSGTDLSRDVALDALDAPEDGMLLVFSDGPDGRCLVGVRIDPSRDTDETCEREPPSGPRYAFHTLGVSSDAEVGSKAAQFTWALR